MINAGKIRITGLKADSKVYYNYSGYPGGMKAEEYKKRLVRKPEQMVEEAITGMLPHTKLGRAMATKLKVYRGDKHPHASQKPEAIAAVLPSAPSSAGKPAGSVGEQPKKQITDIGSSNPWGVSGMDPEGATDG